MGLLNTLSEISQESGIGLTMVHSVRLENPVDTVSFDFKIEACTTKKPKP
jgi:hypothetical protein